MKLLMNSPVTEHRVAARIIDESNGTALITLGKPKQIAQPAPRKELFSTDNEFDTERNLSNKAVCILAQGYSISKYYRTTV